MYSQSSTDSVDDTDTSSEGTCTDTSSTSISSTQVHRKQKGTLITPSSSGQIDSTNTQEDVTTPLEIKVQSSLQCQQTDTEQIATVDNHRSCTEMLKEHSRSTVESLAAMCLARIKKCNSFAFTSGISLSTAESNTIKNKATDDLCKATKTHDNLKEGNTINDEPDQTLQCLSVKDSQTDRKSCGENNINSECTKCSGKTAIDKSMNAPCTSLSSKEAKALKRSPSNLTKKSTVGRTIHKSCFLNSSQMFHMFPPDLNSLKPKSKTTNKPRNKSHPIPPGPIINRDKLLGSRVVTLNNTNKDNRPRRRLHSAPWKKPDLYIEKNHKSGSTWFEQEHQQSSYEICKRLMGIYCNPASFNRLKTRKKSKPHRQQQLQSRTCQITKLSILHRQWGNRQKQAKFLNAGKIDLSSLANQSPKRVLKIQNNQRGVAVNNFRCRCNECFKSSNYNTLKTVPVLLTSLPVPLVPIQNYGYRKRRITCYSDTLDMSITIRNDKLGPKLALPRQTIRILNYIQSDRNRANSTYYISCSACGYAAPKKSRPTAKRKVLKKNSAKRDDDRRCAAPTTVPHPSSCSSLSSLFQPSKSVTDASSSDISTNRSNTNRNRALLTCQRCISKKAKSVSDRSRSERGPIRSCHTLQSSSALGRSNPNENVSPENSESHADTVLSETTSKVFHSTDSSKHSSTQRLLPSKARLSPSMQRLSDIIKASHDVKDTAKHESNISRIIQKKQSVESTTEDTNKLSACEPTRDREQSLHRPTSLLDISSDSTQESLIDQTSTKLRKKSSKISKVVRGHGRAQPSGKTEKASIEQSHNKLQENIIVLKPKVEITSVRHRGRCYKKSKVATNLVAPQPPGHVRPQPPGHVIQPAPEVGNVRLAKPPCYEKPPNYKLRHLNALRSRTTSNKKGGSGDGPMNRDAS